MQITIPQIKKDEAKKFAGVWNYKGVSIIISDVHCQFATDFAQVVIRSFVQNIMQQQAAEVAAKQPKVVIE